MTCRCWLILIRVCMYVWMNERMNQRMIEIDWTYVCKVMQCHAMPSNAMQCDVFTIVYVQQLEQPSFCPQQSPKIIKEKTTFSHHLPKKKTCSHHFPRTVSTIGRCQVSSTASARNFPRRGFTNPAVALWNCPRLGQPLDCDGQWLGLRANRSRKP